MKTIEDSWKALGLEGAPIKKVALIGDHVPRRCGIASFTADLAESLEHHGVEVGVFAVSDKMGAYAYPDRVRLEFDETRLASYLDAARQIEAEGYDVVSLQHEYGIYGGQAGSHVLTLLRELATPVVTTLHTILEHPSDAQFRVMEEIVRRSARLVVMSARGKRILEDTHPTSLGKIEVLPHGVPDGSKFDRKKSRRELGLSNRKVILTFGLLSRDKGIDQMILAMYQVKKQVPDALYVVVGATHPNVVEHEGETYRDSLMQTVSELNLEGHVTFVNEFVPLKSLLNWLVACDVYVLPYLKKEQVTSGTLSYAYGLGKPVVSTPNWHAEELLSGGRGILVPAHDPAALTEAVVSLLTAESEGKPALPEDPKVAEMQWDNVAGAYLRVFLSAAKQKIVLKEERTVKDPVAALPKINLAHIHVLTDDVGIVQHGQYCIPRRADGYCTDDNARAAILAIDLRGNTEERRTTRLERVYVAFLAHAFDRDRKAFHNFMGFDRQWLDEAGSDDCQGRAVWALGHLACRSSIEGHREFSSKWLEQESSFLPRIESPRAIAYSLLGFEACSTLLLSEKPRKVLFRLAEKLVGFYRRAATPDWPWLEPILAYDNARLPQAMLFAADVLGDPTAKSEALESLKWLCGVQTGPDGSFAPIGNKGFYPRGGKRAWFDEQPIEATATIDACLAAYGATRDASWLLETQRAWEWFTGHNSVGMPIMTPEGGAFDGLMPNGVNHNQGAESTICYLSALCAMRSARNAPVFAENRTAVVM